MNQSTDRSQVARSLIASILIVMLSLWLAPANASTSQTPEQIVKGSNYTLVRHHGTGGYYLIDQSGVPHKYPSRAKALASCSTDRCRVRTTRKYASLHRTWTTLNVALWQVYATLPPCNISLGRSTNCTYGPTPDFPDAQLVYPDNWGVMDVFEAQGSFQPAA